MDSRKWSRSDFEYCSHYCEENVYRMTLQLKPLPRVEILSHLIEQCDDRASACVKFYAVFISSRSHQVPIWNQKASASDDPDVPVVWDYHVIFVIKTRATCTSDNTATVDIGNRGHAYILDLDTRLDFPIDARRYFEESFRPQMQLRKEYEQCFRVVPADEFLLHFASDRSHMKDSGMPPPSWPCIRGECADCEMNLFRYIAMHDSSGNPDKSVTPGYVVTSRSSSERKMTFVIRRPLPAGA
jgi:protein N-terminal glutamine amidohydrolase